MEELSLASQLLLWVGLLVIAFLLLGVFRQIAFFRWRLEELATTTPSRIGRDGLKPGARAPAFTLESVDGTEVSLADYAGRKTLLVFVSPGCGPCNEIVPALHALREQGAEVLAISSGDREANRAWAEEHGVTFPVLVQDQRRLSRRYEVFATPFAFLVDEDGVIAAKGIVNNSRHIGFLLSAERDRTGRPELQET